MFKRAAKISFWILLISGWIILSGFVTNYYDELTLENIEINFINDNSQKFITKSEVNSMLLLMGIVNNVSLKKEIQLASIEKKLLNHSAIRNAQVYFNNNGGLKVDITKRKIGRAHV